ncbi:MAG TPA: hypothetical protein VFW95_00335 [Candidatus Limnocylindria bacterium]|nr:hypothetical protein [Candidatus Limnocylindria bacterium]
MPEFRLKLDELRDLQKHELGARKYQHQPPKRPSRLPRRMTPPPTRHEPPDLSLFLYAGAALGVILIVVALPYVVGYLFEVLF